MLFAMVFTISCSGDKGARGPAGIDGKSCKAEPMPNPDQGYVLSCGGEVVGNILNGLNADGTLPGGTPSCHIAPTPTAGYAFTLTCGNDIVNIPARTSGGGGGGSCTVTQPSDYNTFWLRMDCGAIVDICLNSGAFDPTKSVCTNGLAREVDINRVAYNYAVLSFNDADYYDSLLAGLDLPAASNWDNWTTTVLPVRAGLIVPRSSFVCHPTLGSKFASNNYVYDQADEYDPNVDFCQPIGGGYKTEPLCGGRDYANDKFCFYSKPNALGKQRENVLYRCGYVDPTTNGKPFTYKEFCQLTEAVYRDTTRSKDPISGLIQSYPTVRSGITNNYKSATATVKELCAGDDAWWDENVKVSGFQIQSSDYSNNPGVYSIYSYAGVSAGGVSRPAITATTNTASTVADAGVTSGTLPQYGIMSSLSLTTTATTGITTFTLLKPFYGFDSNAEGPILFGERTCPTTGAKAVVAKCGVANSTSGSTSSFSDGNAVLTYNPLTHFCRVNSKYKTTGADADLQKVEIVPLCVASTSTSTKNGTSYDGREYQCNPADGKPGKRCQQDFYNPLTQFCYDPTGVALKGDYCFGDAVPSSYDPRQSFCSFDSRKYDEADRMSVKTSLCSGTGGPALREFNKQDWNWQYCTKATLDGVLSCQRYEINDPYNGAKCICVDGAVADQGARCECAVGTYKGAINACQCPNGKFLELLKDGAPACVSIAGGGTTTTPNTTSDNCHIKPATGSTTCGKCDDLTTGAGSATNPLRQVWDPYALNSSNQVVSACVIIADCRYGYTNGWVCNPPPSCTPGVDAGAAQNCSNANCASSGGFWNAGTSNCDIKATCTTPNGNWNSSNNTCATDCSGLTPNWDASINQCVAAACSSTNLGACNSSNCYSDASGVWNTLGGAGYTPTCVANSAACPETSTEDSSNHTCKCQAGTKTNWNTAKQKCVDSDGCPTGYTDDSGTCKDTNGCTESQTWNSTNSACE